MVKMHEGQARGRGKKVAIVASKFNAFITERLLAGCLEELKHCGVSQTNISVAWVPGAFEIPLLAMTMAKKKTTAAVICLGAVIRGETLHYDLVAQGAAQGIAQVSLQTGKPIIFGVLTTDTVDQAYKRSEEQGDNKGRDAALAALEMVDVMSSCRK